MKMKNALKFYKKVFYTFGVFIAVMLFGYLVNETIVYGNVPHEVGAEIYYDNYRWTTLHTRDENTVTKRYDNLVATKTNKRHVISGVNPSTITQHLEYSTTKRTGHEYSPMVKLKLKVFEAAAGYKFTKETIETHTASVAIPSNSSISVYAYDWRVRLSRLEVETIQQKCYFKNWRRVWLDVKDIGKVDEYITQYEGILFVFEHF